jgi:hypothetical protein
MAAYRMFPPIGPDRGSRSKGARNNNMKRLVRETRRQASVRGRLTTMQGRIVWHSRDRKAEVTGNTQQTSPLEECSLLDHKGLSRARGPLF